VVTLLSSLGTLARTRGRPAFGSVFLLNNTAYLCTKLLKPRSAVLEILSRPTQDALNSNFRTAKAGYFDSNFSPLVQALADDKDRSSGSAGKAAAKEKFTRFFDLLEETRERHQIAKVLEDDEEQRRSLEEDAVKLVVPSLQRFTQKMREKEFSKSERFIVVFSFPSVEKGGSAERAYRCRSF
jgi:exocyst complex protein 7